jgi:hypothetical protein
MPEIGTSFQGIAPQPPRVVGIRYAIFETPTLTEGEPQSIAVPATYRLFIGEADPATSGVGGTNGDWYFWVHSGYISIHRKWNNAWSLVTTIYGGGGDSGESPTGVPPPVQDVIDQLEQDLLTEIGTVNDAVLAEVNARAAAILAEHNDRVAALLQEAADRDAAILSAKTELSTATEAVASDLTVVTAQLADPDTGLAASHARVTAEALARATEDDALGTRVTTLESETGSLDARISIVEGVYTGGMDNEALAFRVGTLEAQVQTETTGLLARMTLEEATRADDVSALATRVTTLESTIEQSEVTALLARIEAEETTRAQGDEALAGQITTIETAVGTTNAAITAEAAARSDGDDALAVRATTLESQMAGTASSNLRSRISTIESTYATTTYVETKKSEAIAAAVYSAGVAAQAYVSQEASARATADGNLSGQWVLRVNAGGVTTGMRLTSTTSPTAGDTSEIVFSATAFKVSNGSVGVNPFQVVGGQVRVANLTISASDVGGLAATATNSSYSAITGTKPPANADVTLAAINGDLNITSGGLVLSGGRLQSGNYATGQAGWIIRSNGTVEFQGGKFRGAVELGFASRVLAEGQGNEGGQLTFEMQPGGDGFWNIDVASNGGFRFFKEGSYGQEIKLQAQDVWCDHNLRIAGAGGGYGYGNFTTYSSRSLKDNIKPLSGLLDKVTQLVPVEFDWKLGRYGEGHDHGLIAEDVEAIFPEVVVNDGKTKAINYAKLSVYLIGAIKELREIIR